MSGLINSSIMQIISMTDSAGSVPDIFSSASDALQLKLRHSAALTQSSIGSACRRRKVCLQTSVALGLQKKVLENSMFCHG